MPNQSQSGWQNDPWHRCDRCGVDFHVSQLAWQNGLLLCSEDTDNPIAWQRQTIIAEVLGDGAPEADVAEILKGESNEPEPPQI
jgi:hypothetical protein